MNRLYVMELYKYLANLQDALKRVGATKPSGRIEFTMRFSSGSTTVFYGESRESLKSVLMECGHLLSEQEIVEVMQIYTHTQA